jgi:flagellar M-ring protein FliF
VKRLSVAVLVDEGVGVDEARVGDLVRAASGYDEARGDLVQVTTLPFDETVATDATKALDEAAKAEEAAGSGLDETITTAATVFLVSLILLLAWRSAKRPERLRKKAEALAAAQDKEERERVQATMREAVDAARALGGPREVMVAGEQQDLILIPQLIAPASSQETRQINDLIERQPDDVARMLRTWLADRRG